eukprot:3431929-Pyramimonas_sp.AAC.1
MAVKEMSHAPFVVLAGDFQQLAPVSGGRVMRDMVGRMHQIHLDAVFRTVDPAHVDFLRKRREREPAKMDIRAHFAGRLWDGSLQDAVAAGLRLQDAAGEPFVWLSVTNQGAADVCHQALLLLGLDPDSATWPGDRKVADVQICLVPGVLLRLTRNQDKSR